MGLGLRSTTTVYVVRKPIFLAASSSTFTVYFFLRVSFYYDYFTTFRTEMFIETSPWKYWNNLIRVLWAGSSSLYAFYGFDGFIWLPRYCVYWTLQFGGNLLFLLNVHSYRVLFFSFLAGFLLLLFQIDQKLSPLGMRASRDFVLR